MYTYRKMLALDEIHKTKGKICSYVLKCDGDAEHPWYIYCGYTRMWSTGCCNIPAPLLVEPSGRLTTTPWSWFLYGSTKRQKRPWPPSAPTGTCGRVASGTTTACEVADSTASIP